MGKRPRRWRSLTIRLAAFAVIGAGSAVLAGWAGGIWGKVPRINATAIVAQPRWPCAVPASRGEVPEFASDYRGWATTLRIYEAEELVAVWEFRSGWPFRSMRSMIVSDDLRGEAARTTIVIDDRWFALRTHALGAVKAPDWLAAGRDIPLVPIWPGFALDTIFYAAIALGLWSAPGFVRRRRRRARGHCPACGYDLKGAKLVACPECGLRREGVAEGTEEVPSASAHEG